MGGQKVGSREYKVMLRRNRFNGDERELLRAANTFWRDFSRRIAGVVVATNGAFGRIKNHRLIAFYDTAKHHLYKGKYVFRERRDVDGGEREVTLKFRHPDGYIAQDRNMDASDREGMRTKFEEDIKTPFVSLYSFSTTLRFGPGKTVSELKDVARLFPDIKNRLGEFPNEAAVDVVGGFTAEELVLSGASLQIGKTPKVEAECALVVWYNHDRHKHRPVAVEFSYRYG